MVLNRNAGELLRRERADRLRHRRARRRARLLRRQDAGRPDVLLQRHPALPRRPELPAAAGQPAEERRRCAPTSATARWPTSVDRSRGRTRTSTTSRRSLGGLREAPTPTHDEQGPEITGRLTRKRIPRTNDYTAGRRALPADRAVGEGRPGAEPSSPCPQCDRPDPGADGLALLPVRGRARASRRRGARHLRRRRAGPAAAAARPSPRTSCSA